mgnify:CR=1 FL=1
MTSEYRHIPVLLPECMKYLKLSAGKTYVDATLGGAGHSLEAAKLIGPTGHLLGIDQDDVARAAASERLAALPDEVRPKVDVLAGNFGELDSLLVSAQIPSIDAILFDIGVSSVQIDTPSRGFSFKETGPLDMRMDQRQEKTARDIVNGYSEMDLYRIIRDYGEDKFAKNIAKHIVQARERQPIETTGELVEIIKAAIPAKIRMQKGHPTKQTFQAIRIELNRELEVLRDSLDDMIDFLNPGGRLCIITFHSLEDRIVKNAFRKNEHPCTCPPDFPVCVCGKTPKGKVVTRKPILPGEGELKENSRSKSAKLRVFERS